jgi:hypothetical protein
MTSDLERIEEIVDEDEELESVLRCGSEDGTTHYLTSRVGEHEGSQILKLRYVGVGEDRAHWTSNGINMRMVAGSMLPALQRVMARTVNGARNDYDETLVLDAQKLDDDDVVRDIRGTVEEEDDDGSDDQDVEYVEVDPDKQDTAQCQKCLTERPLEDLTNVGGGLVDAFVCSGGCDQ